MAANGNGLLQTITLDGGQDVSFVSFVAFGPRDGMPVLLLHGTPACSLGFDFAEDAATALGIRAIAPDRPGIAGSTPCPSETADIAAYAGHVDRLTDALGIDRYAVVGYSGGGPYALALAALRPLRVIAAASMAGVATLDWPGADDGLDRSELKLARSTVTHPRRARRTLKLMSFAMRHFGGTIMKAAEKKLTEADRATLARVRTAHPDAAGTEFITESFRQGIEGVFDDYRCWVEPWGFDLSSITVPVHVWQGDADVFVPMSHAEHIVSNVPAAVLHALDGVGHVSMQDHIEDIIRSVLPA